MNARPTFPTRLPAAVLLAWIAVTVSGDVAHGQDRSPAQLMLRAAPMVMATIEGPETALQFRSQLQLAADQVQQLEAVGQHVMQREQRVMVQIHEAHGDLAAAIDEELDEARARAALERIGELHAQMGLVTLRARHETRAILNQEQRKRLSELAHQQADNMLNQMRNGGRQGADRAAPDLN